MIKLTLMLGVLQTLFMPVLFLGPLCGIVVDRHQGGTGIAGGVIAGIFSGFVLYLIVNIYLFYLGRPFDWIELTVSTTAFVILEVFCGWIWGRSYRAWHSSMANRTAADPKGNGTWERKSSR
jgi:hypothetical protein